MKKVYDFRIHPTPQQEKQIQLTLDGCRFVYNHYLALNIEMHKEKGVVFNSKACISDLPKLKEKFPWLCGADSSAFMEALVALDYALQIFSHEVERGGKPDYPKAKSEGVDDRSYISRGRVISAYGGYIKLPKLGEIRCSPSIGVEEHIVSAKVTQESNGEYSVTLRCAEAQIRGPRRKKPAIVKQSHQIENRIELPQQQLLQGMNDGSERKKIHPDALFAMNPPLTSSGTYMMYDEKLATKMTKVNANPYNGSRFDALNYRFDWWNALGGSKTDTLDSEVIARWIKEYAVGFCEGKNVAFRPRDDSFAVMFKKDGKEFWFHVPCLIFEG